MNSNNNQKCYLLYRPVLDYEESIEPYLVVSSLEEAEKIKAEVIEYYKKAHKSLPEYPEQEYWDSKRKDYVTLSDEEYGEKIEKHVKKTNNLFLKAIKNAPYNIEYQYGDIVSDETAIEIMPLEFINK